MNSLYLKRYAWKPILDHGYPDADVIVVIPSFCESQIKNALDSLAACIRPKGKVLILVIVNESESASQEITFLNSTTYSDLQNCQFDLPLLTFYQKLPAKKAGVGLARKIGMDQAVSIFEHHNKDGIICCFDADCSCDPNYFVAIEQFYEQEENMMGLVYYEHPTDKQNSSAIIEYELFLRLYVNSLRFSGFPHAVQTLGSCITVRSSAYQKQGGMNTRKAGEDFYFIHKTVPLGGIGEINNTCIFPSDRVSERVPFGTGHAVKKRLTWHNTPYEVYSPNTFIDLKEVFDSCIRYYEGTPFSQLKIPDSVRAFYQETSFEIGLAKIIAQSNNPANFKKRFFAWWDAFRVLKFVHFARDHFYPRVTLEKGTTWLGREYLKSDISNLTLPERLQVLRHHDRSVNFYIDRNPK